MQSDWMRTVSYEFEPLEVFKGDPNQIAEIIDTTNQWGLEPVIGAVYLLFMSGQTSNAVVTISPCGPSQRYLPSDEQQTKLLEWLRTRAN
jgi:hypothetical protein